MLNRKKIEEIDSGYFWLNHAKEKLKTKESLFTAEDRLTVLKAISWIEEHIEAAESMPNFI